MGFSSHLINENMDLIKINTSSLVSILHMYVYIYTCTTFIHLLCNGTFSEVKSVLRVCSRRRRGRFWSAAGESLTLVLTPAMTAVLIPDSPLDHWHSSSDWARGRERGGEGRDRGLW